jgi:D-alanine-D-alanine ligase
VSLRVGIVYDLRADYLAEGHSPEAVAEFDSEETIAAIDAAIRSHGHRTERIGNARALCARLVAGGRWDLVFNFAEGLHGRSREAQAPALLELYGLDYTFSDPLVCAVTLDKAVAKRLVREAGLATAAFAVVARPEDADKVALEFPLFAKPLAEGTGKGIHSRSKVSSPAELQAVCRELLAEFAQPVLVEEYLPGREFTVGVLGTGGEARVLGTLEIEVRREVGHAIYSYQTKEACEDLVRYSAPPRDDLRAAVEALALESYRTLECRDAARVDLRLDHRGRPAFLEVNPLPGLHPTHSDLPMIATQEGMAYRDLIGAILRSAARRLERTHGH